MRHVQPREFEAISEALEPERIHQALMPEPPRPSALAESGIAHVRQMGEAIRAAEARANAVEARARELIELAASELISAKSQLRAASAKIRAAEERAQAAELRANEAEAWLRRLHETIARELMPGEPVNDKHRHGRA